MTSSVMKFKKSPELNLSAVMMKKPITTMKLRPSEGLDLYSFCKKENVEVIKKESLVSGAPGFLQLLHEEIVNSFGIDRNDISELTTRVILPGVETTIEPSKPTTHSRYIVVLNVPKNKTSKDENGISAEEAMLSILADDENVVDSRPPSTAVAEAATAASSSISRRGRLSKYPTQKELDDAAVAAKSHAVENTNFKAREVISFSVGGLSKEMVVEEGVIVGLHSIGSSSLSFSFTNEKKVTLSNVGGGGGHDTRKTTIIKNPDRRIVLVIDAELSISGAAKMASKLTSMVDKKKNQALPPGFSDLLKTLLPSSSSVTSSGSSE